MKKHAAVLISGLLVAASALAQVTVKDPWIRATVPAAKSSGAFMQLQSVQDARLVEVRSSVAGMVEIHEMKMDGNIMRMREVEKGIEIPPGATVELKPGGFHVMFMGLRAPFAKDTKVPLTLVFEKAGSIDVDLMVQAMGAQPPSMHKQ